MQKVEQLIPGYYYHIYNRGNNQENIFQEEKNYEYFLDLFVKYVFPIADTFAYCLLRNHFHFLSRMKSLDSIIKALALNQTFEVSQTSKVLSGKISKRLSQQFSKMFNAYAKAFNIQYDRTGSLFQTRFKRKRIKSNVHLVHLIQYIHYNPQKHNFVDDFGDWPYSSYHAFLSEKETQLERREALHLFDGRNKFSLFHENDCEVQNIHYLIDED